MADLETVHRIEELRSSLGDKLAELHRRASHVKERLTPSYYWRNPWVRFGIGAVIGLALASRRRGQPGGPEGLLHSMIRAGLSAAVTGVITRSLALPPGDD
jgi:hypothetical protein